MGPLRHAGVSGEIVGDAWRLPAVAIGLLLIALMMVTIDGPVAELFRGINGDLRRIADILARTGDSFYTLVPSGVLTALFGILYLCNRGTSRGRVYAWLAGAAWFFFVSIAFSGILVNLVKFVIGRARPDVAVSLTWPEFHPFARRGAYHSFPSGHANTLFAIAMALGCFFPSARKYLLAAALPLALCRVAQFKHFLSDTAGGAGLAVMTTLWLRALFARWGIVFRHSADGRVGLAAPGRLLRRRCRRSDP